MIEKAALYLAKKIQSNTSDQTSSFEDTDVLRYGIECIINTAIPVIIYFIYSVCNKMCVDMLLWLISFLILRNYIGGFHANSNIKCIVLSSLFGIAALIVMQSINTISVIIIIIFYCLTSLVIIFCRPIIYDISHSSPQKQLRMLTQKSILTVCIELFLCLIFNRLLPHYGNAIFIGSCCALILYVPEKIKRMF